MKIFSSSGNGMSGRVPRSLPRWRLSALRSLPGDGSPADRARRSVRPARVPARRPSRSSANREFSAPWPRSGSCAAHPRSRAPWAPTTARVSWRLTAGRCEARRAGGSLLRECSAPTQSSFQARAWPPPRPWSTLAVGDVNAGPDIDADGPLKHLRVFLAVEGLETTDASPVGVADHPCFAA